MLLESCDRSFAAAVRCPLDQLGVRDGYSVERAGRLVTTTSVARWTLLVSSLSSYRYFFILGFVISILQPCASINDPPARPGGRDNREIKVSFNNKKSALYAGFWLACLALVAAQAQAQDDGSGIPAGGGNVVHADAAFR